MPQCVLVEVNGQLRMHGDYSPGRQRREKRAERTDEVFKLPTDWSILNFIPAGKRQQDQMLNLSGDSEGKGWQRTTREVGRTSRKLCEELKVPSRETKN